MSDFYPAQTEASEPKRPRVRWDFTITLDGMIRTISLIAVIIAGAVAMGVDRASIDSRLNRHEEILSKVTASLELLREAQARLENDEARANQRMDDHWTPKNP
jgi:hypothetical protein